MLLVSHTITGSRQNFPFTHMHTQTDKCAQIHLYLNFILLYGFVCFWRDSLLIHNVSRSHDDDDVPQSVGLLWTSDQLIAETST
jgi:hypothetical protein